MLPCAAVRRDNSTAGLDLYQGKVTCCVHMAKFGRERYIKDVLTRDWNQ